MNETLQIAKRLVELCKEGNNLQAVDELYADDVVSVEAAAGPSVARETAGRPAVRGKHQWWMENHTIHSAHVGEPLPNGDRFVVEFDFDVTGNKGPTAGRRMQLHEAGLYTVRGGKIVKEEFFYDMG